MTTYLTSTLIWQLYKAYALTVTEMLHRELQLTFEFGEEIKPIESRADEIAEGYKDDIEDI